MLRSLVYKGIDVAVPLTYSQCEALKASKYKFVGRYYTDYLNPKHTWKMMFKDEAKIISTAGLDIVPIYQTHGYYSALCSKEAGIQDCINAIKCAELIGQPFNSTIYFAIETIIDVNEYFLGISEEMQRFRKANNNVAWNIGIYGNYYILKNTYNKYGVLHYWQSMYLSDNKIFDKIDLLQYKFTFPTCNIKEVDQNVSFSYSFGQFKI